MIQVYGHAKDILRIYTEESEQSKDLEKYYMLFNGMTTEQTQQLWICPIFFDLEIYNTIPCNDNDAFFKIIGVGVSP